MSPSPTLIAAYLALFVVVGFATIFVALLLGWFLRARNRTPEKLEVYECGEPPVGSARVQFDLRFYVVALLFIVFDVEVAFFFPWATVFGKVTQLRSAEPIVASAEAELEAVPLKMTELGVPAAAAGSPSDVSETADRLTLAAMVDIAVFFAVLMVGFAYVWYLGDLDWVRAVRPSPAQRGSPVGTD